MKLNKGSSFNCYSCRWELSPETVASTEEIQHASCILMRNYNEGFLTSVGHKYCQLVYIPLHKSLGLPYISHFIKYYKLHRSKASQSAASLNFFLFCILFIWIGMGTYTLPFGDILYKYGRQKRLPWILIVLFWNGTSPETKTHYTKRKLRIHKRSYSTNICSM